MDEKLLIKLVKDVISAELKIVKAEMTTKHDLKTFAIKEDLKVFATKEDLKAFATKDDSFNFETQMTSTLENIREKVRISFLRLNRNCAK